MTAEELILELKDIQGPGEPAWWLFAPAYLVGLGLILMLLIALWFYFQYRKNNRLIIEASQALHRIKMLHGQEKDSRQLALELSKWLKQVSISAFPGKQAEGLTGQAWLEFLDGYAGDCWFTCGNGRIFGGAIYSEHCSLDAETAFTACDHWLSAIKVQLHSRGKTDA